MTADGKKKLDELVASIKGHPDLTTRFISAADIRSISDAFKAMEAVATDAEYVLTGVIDLSDFQDQDAPCDGDFLCGRDVCNYCGCIKDKRDHLRQLLRGPRHEG